MSAPSEFADVPSPGERFNSALRQRAGQDARRPPSLGRTCGALRDECVPSPNRFPRPLPARGEWEWRILNHERDPALVRSWRSGTALDARCARRSRRGEGGSQSGNEAVRVASVSARLAVELSDAAAPARHGLRRRSISRRVIPPPFPPVTMPAAHRERYDASSPNRLR